MLCAIIVVALSNQGPCPEINAEYNVCSLLDTILSWQHRMLTLFVQGYHRLAFGKQLYDRRGSSTEATVFKDAASEPSAYVRAFQKIEKLQALFGATSDCKLEQMGCFSNIADAHDTLLVYGDRFSKGPPTPFLEKAQRMSMVNFLWLIDQCLAQATKVYASADQSPVEYPLTA